MTEGGRQKETPLRETSFRKREKEKEPGKDAETVADQFGGSEVQA